MEGLIILLIIAGLLFLWAGDIPEDTTSDAKPNTHGMDGYGVD